MTRDGHKGTRLLGFFSYSTVLNLETCQIQKFKEEEEEGEEENFNFLKHGKNYADSWFTPSLTQVTRRKNGTL